jgi:MFS family permease
LGYLADKKWGEKEILSVGFILMAITTGIISFINGGSLILWAVILFLTRIGAGMVEVMCSAYFFKQVDSFNVNIISFFRMSGPLAFIFGSLFATILLNSFSFDIKYLFLILGLLMFLGLKFSLSLQDTR